jgi:3-dehydroquinate synthase
MAKFVAQSSTAVRTYIASYDKEPLTRASLEHAVEGVCCNATFKDLLHALINGKAFSEELGREFLELGAIDGLPAVRRLRTCLNTTLKNFFLLLSKLIGSLDSTVGVEWSTFAERLCADALGEKKLLDFLKESQDGQYYKDLAARLVIEDPHAVYPTSSYRESKGHTVSTDDDQAVEAVMSFSTFTSIRVVENVLNFDQKILRDMYIALGRCVCVVDTNVERFYSEQLENYFKHHNIHLEKLVYRAMEVDKGIGTVERMLGDFKRLGVSRNAPVLVIGGGVLSDTAGLACALYHRSTPYVMLSTSIVAGIDAGPSPRTCCDGFGYKNLFGAYHAPVLSLTDRSFFKTLHPGWLRHGIAEIIKMSVTKNEYLFNLLEQGGPRLIETRFGTLDCAADDEIQVISNKILGAAMRSYVEAEYDNLYETHQCRPHAYGHTWSPGFEIAAGLLHGHAVAIGMGFGAFLSFKENWITEDEFNRILRLISSYGLSLWNDILENKEQVWGAQVKMVEKRGGNLAAPLPKGGIGKCGYLNEMTEADLYNNISEYKVVVQSYPRAGLGIEPLCSDVGLEDPSTVGTETCGHHH